MESWRPAEHPVDMAEKVDAVWAQWGAELRRIRSLAGKTQAQLARDAPLSRQQVSALEKGTRTPKREYAEELDRALATGGALTALWDEISDTKDVPDHLKSILKVERQAAEIREYQSVVVPGLLQTEDYARAILGPRYMRRTPEQLQQLVKARTSRLPAIVSSGPLLWFVVRSPVMRCPVGGDEILKRQLERIIDLSEKGEIEFQILPDSRTGAGFHPPFRVSTMPDGKTVGYAEHAMGGLTFDKMKRVAVLQAAFGALQADALSPDDSIAMIYKIKGGL